MAKYRIREETYGLAKRFVVEQKGWFFWRDVLKYDTTWKKFLPARFFTLKDAKDYVNFKRRVDANQGDLSNINVTYHTDI